LEHLHFSWADRQPIIAGNRVLGAPPLGIG